MCSDYFLYKFLSYVFSYIISFVRHAHTYLFENEISFPPQFGQLSGESRPSDKGGGSHPDPEIMGERSPKIFFGPFGPQFGLKIREAFFFRQWTKKSPFSKISGYVRTRPESVRKQPQERVYNS